MSDDITRQTVLFPHLFRRPVVAKFDQPHGSSDGGAITLQAYDARLRLTERLSNCIVDTRQSGKIEHTIGDLVRHVIGLAPDVLKPCSFLIALKCLMPASPPAPPRKRAETNIVSPY